MSIAGEVDRILNSKEQIKSALLARGIDVGNNTIDKYADIINPEIVLNDITPYNLQEASFNPTTKVLSLNASTSAFAHLATINDASYFSMSFRVLSYGVSNPFRFALSTSPSYKIWNSTDNHYRWSLFTSTNAFQCTKQTLIIGQCLSQSNSGYFVLSVKNGTAYVYYGSSLTSVTLISQFSWDASGLYYLNITNASAYAVQIDTLKFSQ